jgi:hypothetical protein
MQARGYCFLRNKLDGLVKSQKLKALITSAYFLRDHQILFAEEYSRFLPLDKDVETTVIFLNKTKQLQRNGFREKYVEIIK